MICEKSQKNYFLRNHTFVYSSALEFSSFIILKWFSVSNVLCCVDNQIFRIDKLWNVPLEAYFSVCSSTKHQKVLLLCCLPKNNSRNSFHNELLKGNSDRRYVYGLCKCIMTNSRTPFVHLSGRGHRFFSSRWKKKKVQVAFLFEPSFRRSIVNTMESKVIIYDAIKISN